MFKKLTGKNNLGINRHKPVFYAWEQALLRGHVVTLKDRPDEFAASVEPNLAHLRTLDSAPERVTGAFNEARNLTLYIGHYASLDDVATYVTKLEGEYADILSQRGAARRVLQQGRLQQTNQDTLRHFGDALRVARNEEIFRALRAGKPVPFEQMTGRLMRPLANALNVPFTEEVERYADNPRKYYAVTYTYEGIAEFSLLDTGEDNFPSIVRRSYSENTGQYKATFSGPATLDNLQRHVYTWLADAVRERMERAGIDDGETPASLIRDVSLEDIATYAMPEKNALWDAIKDGTHEDIFNALARPQPAAMLRDYQTITGTAVNSTAPDRSERPAHGASFLRLVK